MPKWNSRTPVRPGAVRPRKVKVEIDLDVDVPTAAPEPAPVAPVADGRTPAPAPKPAQTRHESLRVTTTPTPDGVHVEILNNTDTTYIVFLTHSDSDGVYGAKVAERNVVIPVTDITQKHGTWTATLLDATDMSLLHTSDFELELSVEWLAESLGRVDIRFAEADGVLDRLGCIAIQPGPPNEEPMYGPDVEDFCIAVLWPDIPDDFDTDGIEFSMEIHRPGSGGIYYTETGPLARLAGYKVMVEDHFPSSEPGNWGVRVMLGSRVMGQAVFRIGGGGPGTPANSEIAVEEFGISLVSGS